MRDYKLSKKALKKIKNLKKSAPHIAKWIKNTIIALRKDEVSGEVLQGFSDFQKLRIWKFRLIYTYDDNILLVAIIEKRETVYKTFKHLLKNSKFLQDL